ncbi:magnesium transporter [Psychromonas sp. RZ22]|nr:magnesium transporter [Psychromonas sp. RZ22]
MKMSLYVAVFVGISAIFGAMSTVHGQDIPESYFANGYPTILGLMNSEFFMGFIFTITLSVVVYVLYLMWTLHEVAVHKAQKVASQHVQVVFALSLCGLFIDKVWWVLAIIIAFTRWDLIAYKLSEIINLGVNGRPSDINKNTDKKQGEK